MGNSLLDAHARTHAWTVAVGALWLAAVATPATAAVPDPVVTGPIPSSAPPGDPSRNYVFFASHLDLAGYGYVEEEYFIEGTANRYRTPGTATGTIIDSGHPYRLRSGYVWVGVSAQRVGVNRLRGWNPARYGTLDVSERNASGAETITNDALSYDIFSQAARAVRDPVGVDPLGGLDARAVIATGHSQSSSRLSTYVNAIQPLAGVIDAFALHGSLGNNIRTDLLVPVWKVNSEFDVDGLEGRVRRPDAELFRTREVAGTSRNDRKSYASRVPTAVRGPARDGATPLPSTTPRWRRSIATTGPTSRG